MRVIADLCGGDLNDPLAKYEFKEIKDNVVFEVSYFKISGENIISFSQRRKGQVRTYTLMWERYKLRVLLSMSAQAFAQLVSANFR